MRARDVVGRKIVALDQTRIRTSYGVTISNVERILLDNGGILYFMVTELEPEQGDYAIEPHYLKPER